MITEGHILPFQVSDLPPGPWLVFAPHADDETIGMGGALKKASEAGLVTELVVMTDGALGGNTPDLVAVRETETREAAGILGIARVDFFREPDRNLQCSEALVEKVAERIRAANPGTVFLPGVMEPHPDHRTTAEVVWRALNIISNATIVRAAYEITVHNPVNCLIDITGSAAGKRAALAVYLSQLGENNYADMVMSLNMTRTFTLPPSIEFAEGFYLFTPQEQGKSLKEVSIDRFSRLFSGLE